jgi:hypothetical protein
MMSLCDKGISCYKTSFYLKATRHIKPYDKMLQQSLRLGYHRNEFLSPSLSLSVVITEVVIQMKMSVMLAVLFEFHIREFYV